jgi:hypothetical protein
LGSLRNPLGIPQESLKVLQESLRSPGADRQHGQKVQEVVFELVVESKAEAIRPGCGFERVLEPKAEASRPGCDFEPFLELTIIISFWHLGIEQYRGYVAYPFVIDMLLTRISLICCLHPLLLAAWWPIRGRRIYTVVG